MPELRTFNTQAEREKWIIDNADYWTVIFRQGLKNHRFEFLTRAEAEEGAGRIAVALKVNCLIYAVSGVNDCFVTGVKWQERLKGT